MPIQDYQKKRDFTKTPEPKGEETSGVGARFVVHEHHATQLHFDLRLEMDGVLKSWAVPKGPSMDPADKRLAVMVEDHPLDYISFRGEIDEGNYGAGEVEIWDSGTYTPLGNRLEEGKLVVELFGAKLKGDFHIVRLKNSQKDWLLMKGKDQLAEPDWKLEQILPGRSRRERQEIKSHEHPEPQKPADPMPTSISPMLATLVEKPFSDPAWLFEIKWDGYRAVAFVEKGNVRVLSRHDLDLSAKFPQTAAIPGLINAHTAILDGEMVVLDEDGKPSFQQLQNYARIRPTGPKPDESKFQLVYYVFDLLYLDGVDLRKRPLTERKEMLKGIIRENGFVRFSDHVIERGEELYEQASKTGLEGVIGKRMDSPYLEKRTDYWLKVKTVKRQEVVIAGYTEPRGSRGYFGALVAGVYEGDSLKYAGQVGSGFDETTLKQLYEMLQPLKTGQCPFESVPKTNEPAQWVRPELVCEVKFVEWTSNGLMRQPVFMGMRPDKPAGDVIREKPKEASELVESSDKKQKSGPRAADSRRAVPTNEVFAQDKLKGNVIVDMEGTSVSLTNLDKVYWPEQGYTKGDLLRYYYRMRETIVPYVKGRPVILKRFPNGIDGEPFYQHNVVDAPSFIRTEAIREGKSVVNYAVIEDAASLLYIVNLGTIAQNAFMSRADSLGNPDWIVLDLDPEEAPFDTVCEVAMALKGVLDNAGISGYPKTSGSRGMHVFIPVEPIYTFEQTQSLGALVANAVALRQPEKATVERVIKNRTSAQVYVDFFQNAPGNSITSPYSVRECAGATVSTPLTWEEVAAKPDKRKFTIHTVPDRVAENGDLFHEVLTNRQRLGDALARLEKLLGSAANAVRTDQFGRPKKQTSP